MSFLTDSQIDESVRLSAEQHIPQNMQMAKEDGFHPYIAINPHPTIGQHRYYWEVKVPCEKCGCLITRKIYKREQHICSKCKKELQQNAVKTDNALGKEIYELNPYVPINTTKADRFERAVKEIVKTTHKPEKYQRAIKIAKKGAEKYGSIPEAMVAIELIRLGYSIIPQQKICGYKVDFAIPKEKIIVEVDGELFHPNGKNAHRELMLRYRLGPEWEIVHVPAEQIRKNITLMSRIMKNAVHRGHVKGI